MGKPAGTARSADDNARFCPFCGAAGLTKKNACWFCPQCRIVFLIGYHRKLRAAPQSFSTPRGSVDQKTRGSVEKKKCR